MSRSFDQLPETLQIQISFEDVSDGFGLGLVDDQLLVLGVVTEGNGATGPLAFTSASSNLVTDPLGGQLALELSKG